MADKTPTESYADAIESIKHAPSLEALGKASEAYSARGTGDGGILYTGKIGDVKSSEFVAQFRGHVSAAIIDDTPRAQFLSNEAVQKAIMARARELYREKGFGFEESAKLAGDFLYGDARALSPEGLPENCQWGRASREFVSSLKGDVVILASNADPNRVFGAVELRAALANNDITSLGGIPTSELRARVDAAHGDISGVLQDVQVKFRADLEKGVFRDGDKLVLSKEFAESYHLSGDFKTAAQLDAAGLDRLRAAAPALAHPPAAVPRGEPPAAAEPSVVEPPAGTGVAAVIEGAEAGARPGAIIRGLEKGSAVVTAAALTYDAVRVTQQYQALAANGNYFAANAMLRTEALSTGGGLIGGIATGAAFGATYGALGGSPTGPGAFVTGAVGGVLGGIAGAVGGDYIARELNERAVNHQTGADGETYAFKDGSWKQEHFFQADTPAPASQVRTLDYRRTTAITELAIGNPPQPDPNHIELADAAGTSQTWEHQKDGSWKAPGGLFGHDQTAADPKLIARLNDVAAQRAFIGAHAPQMAANAYITDYYGKGWDKLGPLPEAVTHTLGRPSETEITDPQTQQTWHVEGKTATRQEVEIGYDTPVVVPVTASGDELKRVLAARDQAVASNHHYGAALIDRNYTEMQQQAKLEHGQDHAALNPAETGQGNRAMTALGVSNGDFATVREQNGSAVAQVTTPQQQLQLGRSA